MAGSYEHGKGIPDSIKGGEFLERLTDYQLFKNFVL
jgi:hypothetical protein